MMQALAQVALGIVLGGKATRVRVFGVLGLALVTGMGLGLASRGPSQSTQGRSSAEPAPPPEWVAANGYTEGARKELLLRPEITGTIRAIRVAVNDDVEAGAVLVELTNDTQQAQVERAAALVKGLEADIQKARDAYDRLRRSGIGAAAGDVRQAEGVLRKAEADLEVVKADLRSAWVELAKTRLRAPWAGRVLDVYFAPGAWVSPASADPVLRLADVSKRRVRAYVEELDAMRVRPGQSAVVTADGLPGREFVGRVSGEVLWRMDRESPRSNAPGEYDDIYHRPVVIDLAAAQELPLNLRVQVRIQVGH